MAAAPERVAFVVWHILSLNHDGFAVCTADNRFIFIDAGNQPNGDLNKWCV